MSVGTKHGRDEGEEQASRLSKKAKTDVAADNDKAEKKKSKKDKRDKDKKDKDRKDKHKKDKHKDKKEEEKQDKKSKKDGEHKDKDEKKKKKKDKERKATEESLTADTTPAATPADSGSSTPSVPLEASAEPIKTTAATKTKESAKSKKSKRSKKDSVSQSAETANGTAAEPQTEADTLNGTSATYKQSSALSALPEADIQAFLAKEQIAVLDQTAGPSSTAGLRPILKFDYLPATPLVSKRPFASFTAPTPIQAASWPYALSGRDVIGIAETGSGKTLAFSLPCLESLGRQPRPPPTHDKDKATCPRAVVVSPTRELAMQTHASLAGLASLVGLSAVCLYGGASKDDQRTLLRRNRGADIVVATPGRLKDFMSEGTVSLARAAFVVLDEADRMLDKGFEEDIKRILGTCPPRERRQTLMFTATWPFSVRTLAEGFMVQPVKITIGGKTRVGGGEDGEDGGADSGELQANSRIAQTVEVVDPRGKEQRLYQILRDAQQGAGRHDRILVFCLYKKEAVRVEQFLQRKGLRVASIHGDLRQEQRTRSLEAFKAGTTTVLVATDVAARGLDIPEVKLVVNVTFPLTIEDYVHRIGRTGRAGKEGKAITLFTEHDKAHSGSLINILRGANQPVPEELMKFGTTVKKKAHDTYGAFFKDVDMSKKPTKITFD